MIYRNRIKFYVFIVFFLFLVLQIKNIFTYNNDFNIADRVYKDNLVLDIFVNGRLCMHDNDLNRFFYSSNMLKDDFKINFNSLYKLEYYIEKVDSYNYFIYAYDDNFYQKLDLVVTNIPLVEVKNLNINNLLKYENYSIYNKLDIVDYKVKNFTDNNSYNMITHIMDPQIGDLYFNNSFLNVRGSSSIWFPKKAYKLSFNNNIDILDLPKDDKYVLDALYVDKSKIRNMLSGDMWNLINNNQEINNDLLGEYVEFFLDDEYLGLYVLKEKVDKSVTNINSGGTIIKSIFHIDDNIINSLKNNTFSIVDDVFLNYEIKHYNYDSFRNLIFKMRNYYINNESYSAIEDNFIVDNYFNYKIFVSLINGGDNVSYNQYYSLVDSNSKILITPWDMDLTWGLNWDDFANLNGIFSMESSYDPVWMDVYITNKMDSFSRKVLCERYWELRKDVITMDVINGYLDKYTDLLVNNGSVKRDSDKWYRYDIQFEIEQIRIWAKNRIEFLDEYFKL